MKGSAEQFCAAGIGPGDGSSAIHRLMNLRNERRTRSEAVRIPAPTAPTSRRSQPVVGRQDRLRAGMDHDHFRRWHIA
jgi:hypothetical protein